MDQIQTRPMAGKPGIDAKGSDGVELRAFEY